MKFLIFNLAVAAALVFLFTADRGDVQKVAGQVHDAAADVKAYAKRTLDKGQNVLDKGTVAAKPPPIPAQQTAPVVTPEKPPPAPTIPSTRQATQIADSSSMARGAPNPALPPDVVKRREEVLNGLPPAAPPAARPVLKEGTKLMPSVDRRKELLSLAEEMELLYARSIGR